MEVDSPDLVIAKQLLDYAKQCGFAFRRTEPSEDGPLVGRRVSGGWVDVIHIAGFSRDCAAMRQRTSSLVLPGGGLVERQVEGSALDGFTCTALATSLSVTSGKGLLQRADVPLPPQRVFGGGPDEVLLPRRTSIDFV